MNRMSRITAIAATALLAAVPAAWAQTGPDAFERAVVPQTSTSQDAFERAAAAGQGTPAVTVHADAFERAARGESGIELTRVAAGDAFERALGAQTASLAQSGLRDQHERSALGATATPTLAAGAESGVEWQQIAAGFALGIVLAAGLALALRMRPRMLAH